MSFRAGIFALVVTVALTAIGATAWLTLSLTSREVTRAQRAQVKHQNEILDAIRLYGVQHGEWPGVDKVVATLAARTGLHIQLREADGAVIVDSDTMTGQPSGPVVGDPLDVEARPSMSAAPGSASPVPQPKGSALADLFGPAPALPGVSLMLREAAQYRAALLTIRCQHRDTGEPAALGLDHTPYLTAAQVRDQAVCVRAAVAQVVGDGAWIKGTLADYQQCVARAGVPAGCLVISYNAAVSDMAPVSLGLFLGARTRADLSTLSTPALVGVAGLIVVALAGSYLIARQVSRPVRRLSTAALVLAAGHLEERVPIRGRGEIARLASSFNTMAEEVQRSEERQRRLIADVAHEMRTPLSNLRGYLEGLSDGVVEPSRELFASLHEETLLQGRILDDLQVLALAESGSLGYQKAPVDLADLAATSSTAHRATAAEAGVAMTVDASSPVWVSADADRLRQVLGNLLSNAIRYTDRGGQVLLRVRSADGSAVLTVQDTGVGISPTDLPRVFDRFWRADPTRQRATGGTGLGLTIAHRIVTDHGGTVEVASQPHLGTTFTVRLPLS